MKLLSYGFVGQKLDLVSVGEITVLAALCSFWPL